MGAGAGQGEASADKRVCRQGLWPAERKGVCGGATRTWGVISKGVPTVFGVLVFIGQGGGSIYDISENIVNKAWLQ